MDRIATSFDHNWWLAVLSRPHARLLTLQNSVLGRQLSSNLLVLVPVRIDNGWIPRVQMACPAFGGHWAVGRGATERQRRDTSDDAWTRPRNTCPTIRPRRRGKRTHGASVEGRCQSIASHGDEAIEVEYDVIAFWWGISTMSDSD